MLVETSPLRHVNVVTGVLKGWGGRGRVGKDPKSHFFDFQTAKSGLPFLYQSSRSLLIKHHRPRHYGFLPLDLVFAHSIPQNGGGLHNPSARKPYCAITLPVETPPIGFDRERFLMLC